MDCDDPQLCDAGVSDFARHEVLRDDADDAAAGAERRIGDGPHQPDVAAAVDERASLRGHHAPERFSGVAIDGSCAGARSAEHANGVASLNVHGRALRIYAAGGWPDRARSRSDSSQTWWPLDMRPGMSAALVRASHPYCVSSVSTCVPRGVGRSSHAC